jgi:hypothetical protein
MDHGNNYGRVLKYVKDVIARSEQRSNFLLFPKGEVASLPEPALSGAKGSLAMTSGAFSAA